MNFEVSNLSNLDRASICRFWYKGADGSSHLAPAMILIVLFWSFI